MHGLPVLWSSGLYRRYLIISALFRNRKCEPPVVYLALVQTQSRFMRRLSSLDIPRGNITALEETYLGIKDEYLSVSSNTSAVLVFDSYSLFVSTMVAALTTLDVGVISGMIAAAVALSKFLCAFGCYDILSK